jgi:ubiquinone/menaquinone biosynthesis C-methylase UbiE
MKTKIDYRETTDDLLKRIDIHNQYGGRDIDKWMLDILPLKQGMEILDVGCGAGKQCFSYYHYLDGNCAISGGDVSEELLQQARVENKKVGDKVSFFELDFNSRFPVDSMKYDLASCCFAIYYAEDIPATIHEMHRVLKNGGKLFATGPMPTNKRVFYDIIEEATGKSIPPMPGSSRYSTQIYQAIQNTFSSVETHIFENPLTFEDAEPFIEYTRASLSEDRKLWSSFFQNKDDFVNIMNKISQVAHKRVEKDGKLVMTKVVGGFLATR